MANIIAYRHVVMLSLCLCLTAINATAQQTTLASKDPLEGYADIHVHQMADLGFGGSIIWGASWGDPKKVLGPIPKNMRRGHDATELATRGDIFKTILNTYIGDLFKHGEEGYPTFSSWPNTRIWTHQQVYEDWLFRAYQGGLRLMVMLAENSEDMFGRGENHIPIIGSRVFQRVKAEGRTGNDMEALEWQVREAYRFQQHIDDKFKGNGWYRIVRDPQEASDVIKSGKLAVILGTEVQHLFNCDWDRPKCDLSTIVEGLNRLEAMGVNYVFPIHHKLNQFGGPAMFQLVNSGPMEKCAGYKHKCSSVGLTDLGRLLIRELMARGMFIDTEHLSVRSFNDTMALVEREKYPVLAGHVVPFDLAIDHDRTERAKNREQITRILNVGGIVAPLLGTAANEYRRDGQSRATIPIKCNSTDGGSADQWANAFLFMRDLAGGGVNGNSGRIAMASDWMGFAGWPGPRDQCDHEHVVRYPFSLPDNLVPDAIDRTRQLDIFKFPDKKLWDYNKTGVAHAGLLPDFFENLRQLGLTLTDLEPIYRSARGVVNLWQTARSIEAPYDLHYLRWAPQSPFDVLNFNYWDKSREIYAREGFPLCRSRRGHLLGFEQNGRCVLVEPETTPVQPSPERIAAYHNGRCIEIVGASSKEGAKIIQNPCGSGTHQYWEVRELSMNSVQLVNKQSGKCVAVKNSSVADRATVVQQTCNGKDNQIWRVERSGNTFSLIAKHSNLCLEARDQNRRDGAAIQQARCTDASNQKWSIESRRNSDFERLYQADKKLFQQNMNVFDWLDKPSNTHPIAVVVDGTRAICKSTDKESWIGVVVGNECVGKTYNSEPVTASQFMQLYQAR